MVKSGYDVDGYEGVQLLPAAAGGACRLLVVLVNGRSTSCASDVSALLVWWLISLSQMKISNSLLEQA